MDNNGITKISVKITGIEPGLLMHSPRGVGLPANALDTPKEQAEICTYRNEDGNLYIENTHLFSALLNGSKGYSAKSTLGKKFSARLCLTAYLRIPSAQISLLDNKGKPIKDYIVDSRRVVIPKRGSIIRHRPLIPEWNAIFEIHCDSNNFKDFIMLQNILSDAGSIVGIMDFRPEKKGNFGRFKVTEFSVVKK